MKNSYLRSFVFFLFSLLSFLSALRALAVPASVSDSTVLVELYASCGGKHWSNALYWNTNKPLEDWAGVTLDAQGRVVSLFLSGKGLTGHLPASLGQLSALKYLGLGDNKLEGEAPASLVKLSGLELLNLQNNLLTGFPSFQSHANPSQLSVFLSGNRLDFGDLEYNYKAAGQSTAEVARTLYGTPQHVKSCFSYDVHGNVAWSLTKRHDLPEQTAEYNRMAGTKTLTAEQCGKHMAQVHTAQATGQSIQTVQLNDYYAMNAKANSLGNAMAGGWFTGVTTLTGVTMGGALAADVWQFGLKVAAAMNPAAVPLAVAGIEGAVAPPGYVGPGDMGIDNVDDAAKGGRRILSQMSGAGDGGPITRRIPLTDDLLGQGSFMSTYEDALDPNSVVKIAKEKFMTTGYIREYASQYLERGERLSGILKQYKGNLVI